jgi:hypothetical protein
LPSSRPRVTRLHLSTAADHVKKNRAARRGPVDQHAVVGNGTIFQRGTRWRGREVWEDDRERQPQRGLMQIVPASQRTRPHDCHAANFPYRKPTGGRFRS